jgi:hypothetical protein
LGGQRLHASCQGLVEPPIAGGPCHVRHLKLQIRAQDVRLIGAPRRPSRDHHNPHEHPEVELAFSLDHAEWLAERLHLLLRQDRLEHFPYLVTGHGRSLRAVSSYRRLLVSVQQARRACSSLRVKPPSSTISGDLGLSGHLWDAVQQRVLCHIRCEVYSGSPSVGRLCFTLSIPQHKFPWLASESILEKYPVVLEASRPPSECKGASNDSASTTNRIKAASGAPLRTARPRDRA